MSLRTIFSKRSGKAAGVPSEPGRAGPHAMKTGIGAAIGAVLVGATGGSLVGPIGTLCGMVVGALVGAVAGRSIARYTDDAREDAYWLERPYTDTSFGMHDRDLAPEHKQSVAAQLLPSGLGDIAANPPSRLSSSLGRSIAGPERTPNWMRGNRRSLSDLAAQGK